MGDCRRDARLTRPTSDRRRRALLPAAAVRARRDGVQPAQLHHVPRGRGVRHGAPRRVHRWADDYPPAARAVREPGRARGDAGDARRQGVDADDGRRDHPRGDARAGRALGAVQLARRRVHGDRDVGHGVDGGDRFSRRLPQDPAEAARVEE